ncbi:MAG: metallophosphoesterase [Bacteroidales bacterium]|nr:metallophosphoesterase [Bacteroidales bacterium]
MIKKVIQIADIHITNEQRRPEDEMLNDLCKAIVKEIRNDNRDEVRIVICGDVFNRGIHANNEARSTCTKFFNKLDKIARTYVIAGNHDLLEPNLRRKDSIAPIFEKEPEYQNVKYLEKELGYRSGCYGDDNVVWALYSLNDSLNRPDIESAVEGKKNAVVIGLYHADMAGTTTETGHEGGNRPCGGSLTDRTSATGISAEEFKGCHYVMCGHIHKYQTLKKNGVVIVYASSAFQREDIGEGVTGHGFVVWNLEEGSHHLVEVKNDYRYFQYEISDYDDIKNDREELRNLGSWTEDF